jgi:hypothetical protein
MLKILDGCLYNPGIKSARIILTPRRAAVCVTFETICGGIGDGEPGDTACLVVNDEAADMTYYTSGSRRHGALDIAIAPAGYPPDFTKVYAYLCFAQKPDGGEPYGEGRNSATAFMQATLAGDEQTRALAR